jgi:hypothetical protein
MGCTPSIHVSQTGVVYCRDSDDSNSPRPSATFHSHTVVRTSRGEGAEAAATGQVDGSEGASCGSGCAGSGGKGKGAGKAKNKQRVEHQQKAIQGSSSQDSSGVATGHFVADHNKVTVNTCITFVLRKYYYLI